MPGEITRHELSARPRAHKKQARHIVKYRLDWISKKVHWTGFVNDRLLIIVFEFIISCSVKRVINKFTAENRERSKRDHIR